MNIRLPVGPWSLSPVGLTGTRRVAKASSLRPAPTPAVTRAPSNTRAVLTHSSGETIRWEPYASFWRPMRSDTGRELDAGDPTSRNAWWMSSWSAKMFGVRVSLIARSPWMRASCSSTTPETRSLGSQVRPNRNRESR